MSAPLVSIIVATYHQAVNLPVTINSLLSQSYQYFEVIILTEDYERVQACVDSFADIRLKLVAQEKSGLGEVLNQGVLQAKGKYIAFINPGDSWHPLKLQRQIHVLESHPEVSLVNSWLRLIDNQGELTNRIIKQQNFWSFDDCDPMALSSVMLRHSCFEVIGMFDTRLQTVPDWDLWLRLNSHYQFLTITEPLVYCQDCASRLGKNWLVAETDLQTTIDKACADVSNSKFIDRYRCYAEANLFLASKVLQNNNPEIPIVVNYCHQALEHDPLIGLSLRFICLRCSIISLSWRQSNFYEFWQAVASATIKWWQICWSNFSSYSVSLLEWMLEEESFSLSNSNKIKQQTKD